MVRYSNHPLFSTVETRPTLRLLNTGEVSHLSFLQILLSTLKHEAANRTKEYATREASISGFGTMYSLLRCTQDLSSQDCRICLSAVIGDLSTWCCLGKQGGRVLWVATFAMSYILFVSLMISQKRQRLHCLHFLLQQVLQILKHPLLFSVCLVGNESHNLEPLQFGLATIEAATNKFFHEKCLGQGGFGQVYKGVLSNGQELAVKRLSKNSGQGGEEFKNEILLIAKLQHINLVALLGFCIEEQEKILVYEYVRNLD
ncbi:putative cysteine-rich receptor-like protein kinase 35 [Neltuma alba]|uniref:putative cysteine-rich receptor-like protein kinase 35 n=1 Tax=Neltuma alba TaxID=207710 RepID=UPI0010A36A8C|nr:putative cysteine-rich receptor-like protein kinase 35 [Prosopis alba]